MNILWPLAIEPKAVIEATAASVFGFILYSHEHVHIKKLLNDEAYWRAIHEVSGPHWTIFAARILDGPNAEEDLEPPSSLLQAVSLNSHQTQRLLQIFSVLAPLNPPVMTVFALDSAGDLRSRCFRIRGTTVEQAYGDIRLVVKTVSGVLTSMGRSISATPPNPWAPLAVALDLVHGWRLVTSGLEIWSWLKSRLS